VVCVCVCVCVMNDKKGVKNNTTNHEEQSQFRLKFLGRSKKKS